MNTINASVVTYYTKEKHLIDVSKSFHAVNLTKKLIFVDNSQAPYIETFAQDHSIDYIKMPYNKGFGAAHNEAIFQYAKECRYFLVLNPDVIIPEGAIEGLCAFMDENPTVVLSSPLIRNPDGSIQYVHKRLPSFSILFTRRFLPKFLKSLFQQKLDLYELRDQKFVEPLSIPNISGCFMLFRSEALLKLNGFDERFFMYLEDIDISRRATELGDVVLFPNVSIIHEWARGSYHSFKLMRINIESTFKYFIKWLGRPMNLPNYEVKPFKKESKESDQ